MTEYLKIAWRNIWRNKKRSLITISSVFFATFLSLIMRSFQLGSYDYMINSMIESYSGFITVENKDFPDEQIIDNSFEYSEESVAKIRNINNVKSVAARLSSFSLASFHKQTKGIMLTGIVPEEENLMSKLNKKIVRYRISNEAFNQIQKENLEQELLEKIKSCLYNSYIDKKSLLYDLMLEPADSLKYHANILKLCEFSGQFLKQNDPGVLIGDRLSKYLKIFPGDTLILIGQGYHGASAQGLFPVRGIVKIPNPKLDNLLIYGEIGTVQQFYSAYEISDNQIDTIFLLSKLAINIEDKSETNLFSTRDNIKTMLNDDNLTVRDWKKGNKELSQQIESDNKSGQMMLGILYIVIAFGLLGTVLMMTAERKREMGIMLALGMKKIKIAITICIEMFFIAFIGLFSGVLVSIPVVLLGYYNPIRMTGETAKIYEDMGFEAVMPMAWFGEYYLDQIFIVFVLVLLIMIYPILNIRKLNIINALRG